MPMTEGKIIINYIVIQAKEFSQMHVIMFAPFEVCQFHGNWSKEDIDIIRCHHLSWFQLYLLGAVHEVLDVFEMLWDWQTKGWMMLANSLATPYMMDPLL